MTWSPWSDSRAWWVTRVGFLSIPVRPGILKTPTHFANHAQLLDKESVLWSSSGAMAPCKLRLWPRLLRWSKD